MSGVFVLENFKYEPKEKEFNLIGGMVGGVMNVGGAVKNLFWIQNRDTN